MDIQLYKKCTPFSAVRLRRRSICCPLLTARCRQRSSWKPPLKPPRSCTCPTRKPPTNNPSQDKGLLCEIGLCAVAVGEEGPAESAQGAGLVVAVGIGTVDQHIGYGSIPLHNMGGENSSQLRR